MVDFFDIFLTSLTKAIAFDVVSSSLMVGVIAFVVLGVFSLIRRY